MKQTRGSAPEVGDASTWATVEYDRATDHPARPRRYDAVVRWANLVVWTFVAVLATALGIILIPLHLPGGFLIPIAPVISLAGNFLVPKLMLTGTGWSAARFIPSVIWAVVTLVGAAPTGNGDLLIAGDSHSSAVGLAYLACGGLGAVLGIFFAASPMRRPRRAG